MQKHRKKKKHKKWKDIKTKRQTDKHTNGRKQLKGDFNIVMPEQSHTLVMFNFKPIPQQLDRKPHKAQKHIKDDWNWLVVSWIRWTMNIEWRPTNLQFPTNTFICPLSMAAFVGGRVLMEPFTFPAVIDTNRNHAGAARIHLFANHRCFPSLFRNNNATTS